MTERQQGVTTMSKGRPARQTAPPATFTTTSTPPVTAKVLPEAVEAAPVVVRTAAGRIVEDYRRCPICWSGSQGYGTRYSGSPSGRSYYRCDQSLGDAPPCGHTWSVIVTLHSTVIQHKTVQLDGLR